MRSRPNTVANWPPVDGGGGGEARLTRNPDGRGRGASRPGCLQ